MVRQARKTRSYILPTHHLGLRKVLKWWVFFSHSCVNYQDSVSVAQDAATPQLGKRGQRRRRFWAHPSDARPGRPSLHIRDLLLSDCNCSSLGLLKNVKDHHITDGFWNSESGG